MRETPTVERAAEVGSLGHSRTTPEQRRELAAAAESDPDPRVRAIALGALVRAAPRRSAASAWRTAARDRDASVRRRAAELAPALGAEVSVRCLLELLVDDVPLVAEAAAFALGEHPRAGTQAIAGLGRAASTHADPLVREAAVAALGARGDPSSRAVVLAACDDKPAVRRRAVLALAAFDGPEVEERLRNALDDRDWQVRQAAEDLLGTETERAGADFSRAGRSAP
jgi:HEAT repeat protein